mmetsp:Transcript_13028/g.19657  ORF Transcript_13028/g.19657 Transcript_13028/m.19657 type:complete len:460 (+) Transcript_13028:44-1423(+)
MGNNDKEKETKQQSIKERKDKHKEKNRERAKKIGTPKIVVETEEERKKKEDEKTIRPNVNKTTKEFHITPVTPQSMCPLEGTITNTPETPKKETTTDMLIYDKNQQNKLITPIKKPKEEKNENLENDKPPTLFTIYGKLWKTKLSILVVFTAIGTYACTKKRKSWKEISTETLGITLGTFGQAAFANTLNELWEIKRDSMMQRTKYRPLPQKHITKTHAFAQGLFMGTTGTLLLAVYGSKEAALLGVMNIGLYAFVYTPMKTVHWLNTWVGTINGAIPPLMGSIVATKQSCLKLNVNRVGYFMGLLMYFWQIPHFMAISYKCGKEYKKAGYHMLPIESPTHSAVQSIVHAVALYPLCWSFGYVGAKESPTVAGKLSWVGFSILSTIATTRWLVQPAMICYHDFVAHQQEAATLDETQENERKHQHYHNATNLFWGSLKYLPVVFGAAMISFSFSSKKVV